MGPGWSHPHLLSKPARAYSTVFPWNFVHHTVVAKKMVIHAHQHFQRTVPKTLLNSNLYSDLNNGIVGEFTFDANCICFDFWLMLKLSMNTTSWGVLCAVLWPLSSITVKLNSPSSLTLFTVSSLTIIFALSSVTTILQTH